MIFAMILIIFICFSLPFIFLSVEGLNNLLDKKNKYKHLSAAAFFLSLGCALSLLFLGLELLFYAK